MKPRALFDSLQISVKKSPLERWREKSKTLSKRLACLQNGAAELTQDAKTLIDCNAIWTELKAELELLSFGKCWRKKSSKPSKRHCKFPRGGERLND
jgi:hypothetical protein